MPTIVRSMAIATTDRPERCYGEIRGPGAVGRDDVGPIGVGRRSGPVRVRHHHQGLRHRREPGPQGRPRQHPPGRPQRRARHGRLQRRRHPASPAQRAPRRPPARPPDPRPGRRSPARTAGPLRRTRAGSRRHTYHPALALLRRAGEPVGPDHLAAFADERTRAQHDLLAATLVHLEDVTGQQPVLRSDHGGLSAGPAHVPPPGRRGDPGHLDGITIDGVLLDVPGPAARRSRAARARSSSSGPPAGPPVLALGPADVERAVALALA